VRVKAATTVASCERQVALLSVVSRKSGVGCRSSEVGMSWRSLVGLGWVVAVLAAYLFELREVIMQ